MSALFLVLLLMPAAAGGLAAAWKKEFCFLCWG